MAKTSIVICKKYDRFENVLFRMKHDDFRFNSDEFGYKEVSEVVSVGEKKIAENGHQVTIVTCANGKQYEVFSDWSAKESK